MSESERTSAPPNHHTTKTKTKCKVNSDGTVCLEDILNSFNSPIGEEHAWALAYQCAKYFRDCISNSSSISRVTELHHVYLQTDGNVHERTVRDRNPPRKSLRYPRDAVADLGTIIFSALDHESSRQEERVVGSELEELIGDMIGNYEPSTQETDDEGIERDSEEQEGPSRVHQYLTLGDVVRRCESHLGSLTKGQAEAHYKAVVRALVAEGLELSTFLERVAQGTLPSTARHSMALEKLEFSDWARFWMQVIGELRMGVKLKKVHYTKAPIEFELTPYEILMKDIRSCRYNLRKVMINGDVPSRVSKDAHAIILEFIRSRPPLKKVSDRKLAPHTRTLSPREQLLSSIQKGRKLRPVPIRATPHKPRLDPKHQQQHQTPKDSTTTPAPKPARRLIKVDFSQFDDDDDDDEDDEKSSSASSSARGDDYDDDVSMDSPQSSEPGLWSSEYRNQAAAAASAAEEAGHHLEAYDLATEARLQLPRSASSHRHTLEVLDPGLVYCYSVPQSRPGSRQSCNSSEASDCGGGGGGGGRLEPETARRMQEELTSSEAWQEAMTLDDRLSLTLSEIVHIRAVLTKAELEALPVEARVRHDVEARKVCFLCLKTRFGIFGPWGQRCALCKRTVCSKCCCRMHVPMEHFATVPVVLLSPSIMTCSPLDEKFGGGGGQRSPQASTSIMETSTTSEPGGLGLGTRFRSKALAAGRAARVVDRFKAGTPQMVVCHDCRLMVLQIIKSARANRSAIRNKTLQSLTLNLSPVF